MSWDVEGKDEEAQIAALGRLRKLVLLGDTKDPDGIIPLVNSSPGHVALAVHEATDCHIPAHVDPQQKTGRNRSFESVHSVSLKRGHSTPHMAGKFASEIGARRLVLNHVGVRCGMYTFIPSARSCVTKAGVCSLAEYTGSRHWEGMKTDIQEGVIIEKASSMRG